MNADAAAALVVGAIVLGALGVAALALRGRQNLRELVVRERIAMIEKGLMPPPEVDPGRFDRLVEAQPRRPELQHATIKMLERGTRYRSAGVMLMGLGLAIFVLIAFAAQIPEVAFGIGGGLAALGLAVFVNGVLLARSPATYASGPPRSDDSAAAPPPQNQP